MINCSEQFLISAPVLNFSDQITESKCRSNDQLVLLLKPIACNANNSNAKEMILSLRLAKKKTRQMNVFQIQTGELSQ